MDKDYDDIIGIGEDASFDDEYFFGLDEHEIEEIDVPTLPFLYSSVVEDRLPDVGITL